MNAEIKREPIAIAPSILSADFTRLGEEVKAVVEAGADLIHIDVMDGRFVSNITIGPFVVKWVNKITDTPLDVHLMIVEPERYIEDFIKAGANLISIHAEACVHLDGVLHTIKQQGVSAGVAINPATPLVVLEEVLDVIDFVVVMSVNPGFGGQKFLPSCLKKAQKLHDIRQERNLGYKIQMDGGVGPRNVGDVYNAGVDMVVAGSAIYGTENYGETIALMRKNTQSST